MTTFRALTKKGTSQRSAIVGGPDGFDLIESLKQASEIKVAIAFGHMSGWKLLSDAIKESKAVKVDVLLGTAFFQTEPSLILELANLSKVRPAVRVKLASPHCTFHPKVWIAKVPGGSIGLVGSGNLSHGGLIQNAECTLYTNAPKDVEALDEWFSYHWSNASEFELAFEDYRKHYEKLKLDGQFFNQKMKDASQEYADRQAKTQLTFAVEAARLFWISEEGKLAIQSRLRNLAEMRKALDYPNFDFGETAWVNFFEMSGFGWIRYGHYKKTIAELDALKAALVLSKKDAYGGLDALLAITGIGRNLATKLLAVCNSQEFVVLNSPVEASLDSFGMPGDRFSPLNSQNYKAFIKCIAPFIEESDALNLDRASALDAFFFKYRGAPSDPNK